jgi:hypothetical protein
MSWKVINQILGLAAIDKAFAQELLQDPIAAVRIRGFELTPEEQKTIEEISVSNLREFSQHLLQELKESRS